MIKTMLGGALCAALALRNQHRNGLGPCLRNRLEGQEHAAHVGCQLTRVVVPHSKIDDQ